MSKHQENISVVILSYNSEKWIGRCLSSLTNNERKIKEIIVVDNHSSDRTTEEVKKFENVRLISNKKNIGFSGGVNVGIKKARGDKILILNPDTMVNIGSIKKLGECMIFYGADIAGGKLSKRNNDTHNSFVRAPDILTGLFDFTNLRKIIPFDLFHKYHYYLNDKYPSKSKEVDAVSGAFMMVNKKVFAKVGLFDERFFMYLEDIDFCLRARQLGYKVIFCPESEIFHEGGASSDNIDKINHTAWSDSRKYYFSKHFTVFVNTIIQPIFILDDLLTVLWRKIKSL